MKYIINENIKLVRATISDFDVIVSFQSEVIDKLFDKEYFTPLSELEIKFPLLNNGIVYLLYDGSLLVGLFILTINPLQEVAREYEFEDNNFAIFDSVMIRDAYRGSHLQAQGMKLLEKTAKKIGVKTIVATVHPDNIYSIDNFKKMTYEYVKTITIHGGERIIFRKDLV